MLREDFDRYRAQTSEFIRWAAERLENLHTIRRDYRFLYSSDGLKTDGKMLVAVDFFDTLNYAFPFVSQLQHPDRKHSSLPRHLQDEILKSQIARSSLFFAFRSGEPLLLPPVYVEEANSQLDKLEQWTPSPGYLTKATAELFSELTADQEAPLSSDQSSDDDGQLSKLMHLSPRFLFLLAGAYEEGAKIFRGLFTQRILTRKIEEWLPLSNPWQGSLEAKWIDFLEDRQEQESLFDKFYTITHRRKRVFRKSYLHDIVALRLVQFLNMELNKQDVVVIFYSSAAMIKEVIKANPKFAKCHFPEHDEQTSVLSFYRSPDVFRLYPRYTRIDQQTAILDHEMLGQDIKLLEDFVSKDSKDRIAASISSQTVDPSVVNQMDRLSQLKDDLFEAHALEATYLLTKRCGLAGIEPDAILKVSSQRDIAKKLLGEMGAYRTDAELHARLDERILQTKIGIAFEYVGWMTIVELATMRTQLRQLYNDFLLFPYRVCFRTTALRSVIKNLKDLFRTPTGNPTDSELDTFRSKLYSLAQGCAETGQSNFWQKDIKISEDYASFETLERRLVWLVLLFALRHYRLVYRNVDHLLQRPIPHLTNDFRIVYLQACLREVWSERGPKGHGRKFKAVEKMLNQFTQWCNTDPTCQTDSRLLYLAAFVAASLGRKSPDVLEGGRRWHPEYDGTWAIQRCQQARKLLKENVDDGLFPDDDLGRQEKDHLVASIIATQAYSMAIEASTEKEILNAIRMYEEEIKIDDRELTSVCLHNRGYAYMKAMEMVENIEVKKKFRDQAKRDFELSDNRRLDCLGIEDLMRKPLRALIKRADKDHPPRRLLLDCIRLRQSEVDMGLV